MNPRASPSMGNRKTAGGNALALSGTVVYSGNYYTAANGSGNTGANNLNQYGSRDVPRKLDVFGFADANATVTVNGNSTTWVEDFWFNQLSFTGNNSAQWAALNITAILGGNTTSVTGNRFLAENPEVFSYDADGNLLSDGRWNYSWDAENRLIQMITTSAAVTAGVTKEKITFAYDSQNRKVQKKVFGWNGSDWNSTPDVNLLYLYDGWNLIAEMDASSTPIVARSYVWGLDLSGGIGGLLMANLGDGNTTQLIYYGYDGNGNVNSLADANGDLVGTYDYDAFGKVVQMTGVWAGYNPFRFATEYLEADATYGGTSLGVYNNKNRYYLPEVGRFANRDPIEESGGPNLYAYCNNDGINYFDPYGQNPFVIDPGPSPIITIGNGINKGLKAAKDFWEENLASDWAGRAILKRWLTNGGDWIIYDDNEWSEYMMANAKLKIQVKLWLITEALNIKKEHGGKSFSEKIRLTKDAEIDNGESIIGYQLLHGTNADVGGFEIIGEIKYDACKFVFNMAYVWNDLIDPNKKYATDSVKASLGKIVSLGKATDYRIWITWHADSFVRCDGSGNFDIGEGWPY